MTMDGRGDPTEIRVETLARMRSQREHHILLDVREDEEVQICRLSDSLHIPMNAVPASLDSIPRDCPVVVLCHHGVRSRIVTDYLRRMGFDRAVNLAGGIDAWARETDSSVPLY